MNVFSRDVVERTVAMIRSQSPSVALFLRSQLKAEPVPKPPLHRGGKETDYLELSLTPSDVNGVVVALLAELLRGRVDGELFPGEESALFDLYERWEQYWYVLAGM